MRPRRQRRGQKDDVNPPETIKHSHHGARAEAPPASPQSRKASRRPLQGMPGHGAQKLPQKPLVAPLILELVHNSDGVSEIRKVHALEGSEAFGL